MQLLIKNIHQLIQVEDTPKSIVKGAEMKELPILEKAFLLLENERIKDFGTMDACPPGADKVVDASGKMVFPAGAIPIRTLFMPPAAKVNLSIESMG